MQRIRDTQQKLVTVPYFPETGHDGADPVAELAKKLASLSMKGRARLAKMLKPEE